MSQVCRYLAVRTVVKMEEPMQASDEDRGLRSRTVEHICGRRRTLPEGGFCNTGVEWCCTANRVRRSVGSAAIVVGGDRTWTVGDRLRRTCSWRAG
nr:hypothetical protein CFP56_32361 [Quercus suber]